MEFQHEVVLWLWKQARLVLFLEHPLWPIDQNTEVQTDEWVNNFDFQRHAMIDMRQ